MWKRTPPSACIVGKYHRRQTLSDCALRRTPRPGIWRECGSLRKQNWNGLARRVQSTSRRTRTHTHTHKHTHDRWIKLLPPCLFWWVMWRVNIEKKKKKRQCSRERGGSDWLEAMMSSLSGVIFSLRRVSERREGRARRESWLNVHCDHIRARRSYMTPVILPVKTQMEPWSGFNLRRSEEETRYRRPLRLRSGRKTPSAVVDGRLRNSRSNKKQDLHFLGEHKMSQQQNAWKGEVKEWVKLKYKYKNRNVDCFWCSWFIVFFSIL